MKRLLDLYKFVASSATDFNGLIEHIKFYPLFCIVGVANGPYHLTNNPCADESWSQPYSTKASSKIVLYSNFRARYYNSNTIIAFP